ncbi:MAG: CcmD family protein [Ferruginibacter sp.]
MNKLLPRLLLLCTGLFSQVMVFAQENGGGLDATMRGNGKIYVVVASCLLILLGLFAYVFLIDRKISRMEKEK